MPLIIIVMELLRRSIRRAVCGAISPAKDISPVTLIMEPTIRVDNASTAARTGFSLTPNARHSLSLRDISSICRLSSSMPISPIRNMGSMERSFESVVFPNVPISQYSIAASSFSGSAKYLSAIIMALDMAFITMPASTYVLVERERVALTSSITHTTAAKPPQKAPLAIANMPDVEMDTIAIAAPRFAPPAMPIISGEARGFLNII